MPPDLLPLSSRMLKQRSHTYTLDIYVTPISETLGYSPVLHRFLSSPRTHIYTHNVHINRLLMMEKFLTLNKPSKRWRGLRIGVLHHWIPVVSSRKVVWHIAWVFWLSVAFMEDRIWWICFCWKEQVANSSEMLINIEAHCACRIHAFYGQQLNF